MYKGLCFRFFIIILKHPLIIVIFLFLQTLNIFIILFYIIPNIWVRFLYYLIFIGGLIIIFMYLASLIPNELFISLWLTPLIIRIIIFKIFKNTQNYNLFNTSLNHFNISEIYSLNYSHRIIVLIILYLLIRLLVNIKMCQKIKTPLKTFSYENT